MKVTYVARLRAPEESFSVTMRKMVELPSAPEVGAVVNNPVWDSGRKVKKVEHQSNEGQSYASVFMEEEILATNKRDCEARSNEYLAHGWQRVMEGETHWGAGGQ